jgi:hypothetical protein
VKTYQTTRVNIQYNIVRDRDLSDAAAKIEGYLKSWGTFSGTAPNHEEKGKAEGESKLSN